MTDVVIRPAKIPRLGRNKPTTPRFCVVSALFKELQIEWDCKRPDLNRCDRLLTDLKLKLSEVGFLPCGGTTASKRALQLARDVLELGVRWSIAAKDFHAFERYMTQLKCYYFDYKQHIDKSPATYELLGLNLLYLLSKNRIAEFHTELELIPADQLQNVYIKHPVALEQYIMEGFYSKVFAAKRSVPSECYSIFMEALLQMVRSEIAECMEKAYRKITFKDAGKKLHLPSEEEVKRFGNLRGWKMRKGSFVFAQEEKNMIKEKIAAVDMAKETIEYAKELVMIV